MNLKIIRNILLISSLVIISFGSGFRLGQNTTSGNSLSLPETIIGRTSRQASLDFSLFWDVWERLNRYYIDKKAINPQKMIYGAISGMVASLGDPYTVFLPPDQNKEAKDDLGGRFEGIGAQLGVKDKKIVVVAPLKNSPAEKAGLKPGDWIVKVDGKDTYNSTLYEVTSKIRGPKGTDVVLTIIHKDASKSADITMKRETIKVTAVEWEIKNAKCNLTAGGQAKCEIRKENCEDCEKVIYLKLDRFGDQTSDEWNKAVDEIKNRESSNNQIKGLVFDLRNNPGGYLTGSVFIASEFLKDGTVVIQESASGGKQNFSVSRKGRLLSIPMVVLINKGSASASEIVAGALQERGRAKIIGETSFGKGSVQEAQELTGGAGIHITTAKWLLPGGKWINSTGVEPDVKVSNEESKPDEDLQLIKAIETIIGGSL